MTASASSKQFTRYNSMPKLIKDLTLPECDEWAARMQGWEFMHGRWWRESDKAHKLVRAANRKGYHPTTNGGQAMALLVNREATVDHEFVDSGDPWSVTVYAEDVWVYGHGQTYMEAIVRACLTAHYGEEVPDED